MKILHGWLNITLPIIVLMHKSIGIGYSLIKWTNVIIFLIFLLWINNF